MADRKPVNTALKGSKPRTSEAKLPHEHDESVGMTDGIASTTMKQAHQDLERGLQDTDRGPVLDNAYKKLKRTP